MTKNHRRINIVLIFLLFCRRTFVDNSVLVWTFAANYHIFSVSNKLITTFKFHICLCFTAPDYQ